MVGEHDDKLPGIILLALEIEGVGSFAACCFYLGFIPTKGNERESSRSRSLIWFKTITRATATRQPPAHARDVFVITPSLGKACDVDCAVLKHCCVTRDSESPSLVYLFLSWSAEQGK